MDSVWKTFRAAKMCSTAAWALSVTSLASVLGSGAANAFAVTCVPGQSTAAGASTVETATTIGSVCEGSSIVGDQSFPGYWEFTWNGSANPAAIGASVTQNGDTGSFQGDLALYDAKDNFIESSDFSGSFYNDDPAVATLDYTFTPGTQYIVGIELPVLTSSEDPPFTITFDTAVPEPASIGLFGGALAALGWLRKRRKQSSD